MSCNSTSTLARRTTEKYVRTANGMVDVGSDRTRAIEDGRGHRSGPKAGRRPQRKRPRSILRAAQWRHGFSTVLSQSAGSRRSEYSAKTVEAQPSRPLRKRGVSFCAVRSDRAQPSRNVACQLNKDGKGRVLLVDGNLFAGVISFAAHNHHICHRRDQAFRHSTLAVALGGERGPEDVCCRRASRPAVIVTIRCSRWSNTPVR